MKKYIIGLIVVLSTAGYAQEGYTQWIKQAEDLVEQDKEEARKKALDYYEEAFAKYADSISLEDRYEAALLAAELKEIDRAFVLLTPMLNKQKDGNGFRGWTYLLHEDATEEFQNVIDDPRWKPVVDEAQRQKSTFLTGLKQQEEEFFQRKEQAFTSTAKGKKLYEEIKNYNPYVAKKQRDYSIGFQLNDSTKTSYFIHLPQNYDPTKRYALLFFLHGAVRYSPFLEFQTAELNLGSWNRYYTKYADRDDIILVFPRANTQYNWMTSDAGFFMVPTILKEIKKTINVDDTKVFLAGHSNGATGVFSYAMKQPSPYAGFYGFNTKPKVMTGGTFIENSKSRSFISFSTDQDYYYPPQANTDFTALMNQIQADYKEYRYLGFPHWFPSFDESEPAYQILFDDVKQRKRNTFAPTLSWEFDDEAYGSIDWLQNMKLDTLQAKASWHQPLNFKIFNWLEYNDEDELIAVTIDEDAFDFPRASGKVKATYKDNVFRLSTSCIKAVSIYISPDMVNIQKPIQVYINDKLYYNKKVEYDTAFMLRNFEQNHDRNGVWINTIELEVTQ
ncbi:hypothetical protein ACKUSY_16175 [Myroides odoratus]